MPFWAGSQTVCRKGGCTQVASPETVLCELMDGSLSVSVSRVLSATRPDRGSPRNPPHADAQSHCKILCPWRSKHLLDGCSLSATACILPDWLQRLAPHGIFPPTKAGYKSEARNQPAPSRNMYLHTSILEQMRLSIPPSHPLQAQTLIFKNCRCPPSATTPRSCTASALVPPPLHRTLSVLMRFGQANAQESC